MVLSEIICSLVLQLPLVPNVVIDPVAAAVVAIVAALGQVEVPSTTEDKMSQVIEQGGHLNLTLLLGFFISLNSIMEVRDVEEAAESYLFIPVVKQDTTNLVK